MTDERQYGFVCVVTGSQQPVGQAIIKELAGEFSGAKAVNGREEVMGAGPRREYIRALLTRIDSSWCCLHLRYALIIL